MPSLSATPLLDIHRIYLEPAAEAHARGREILARFPKAERILVGSHWRIPALREADPGDFLQPKREVLVLGVKKGMTFRPNGRSADFIAPSTSNGCAMACAYCYVARRKACAPAGQARAARRRRSAAGRRRAGGRPTSMRKTSPGVAAR